ncbi:hypothetical protein ASPZODRAFT_72793 [Penicilliopsis zonata CBS 506.65]|uniref:Uncharacterized protein n=1 Tax=Penicilliopsis zonata CBS 506.65 TaxID=1073090 RepID=A0A1L9SAK6_9EURO|nr:hypothetical protein ASPZODRAFT_72793 [Penicilliopsis zonata CBS 506.65]OJJ44171.1 hypothetical protein ASPZODRAFT_72793 [Penicilliopsis zonata CBS 506.65]
MQWLVTGCSTGLGLDLARAILQAGHSCIATSRSKSTNPSAVLEIESLGGVWAELDVTAPDAESVVLSLVREHGGVDVLVNNAGYALGGVVETFNIDSGRALMETNFFGPARLIQSLLPSMTSRGTGVIVNISSAEFWHPHPGTAFYAATKFAIEGFSEALAAEVLPLGIRVLIVEPGAMRTHFIHPHKVGLSPLPAAYVGTPADTVLKVIISAHGLEGVDPRQAAQAVVREVTAGPSRGRECSLRMPLGGESVTLTKARGEGFSRLAAAVAAEDVKCDFA